MVYILAPGAKISSLKWADLLKFKPKQQFHSICITPLLACKPLLP